MAINGVSTQPAPNQTDYGVQTKSNSGNSPIAESQTPESAAASVELSDEGKRFANMRLYRSGQEAPLHVTAYLRDRARRREVANFKQVIETLTPKDVAYLAAKKREDPNYFAARYPGENDSGFRKILNDLTAEDLDFLAAQKRKEWGHMPTETESRHIARHDRAWDRLFTEIYGKPTGEHARARRDRIFSAMTDRQSQTDFAATVSRVLETLTASDIRYIASRKKNDANYINHRYSEREDNDIRQVLETLTVEDLEQIADEKYQAELAGTSYPTPTRPKSGFAEVMETLTVEDIKYLAAKKREDPNYFTRKYRGQPQSDFARVLETLTAGDLSYLAFKKQEDANFSFSAWEQNRSGLHQKWQEQNRGNVASKWDTARPYRMPAYGNRIPLIDRSARYYGIQENRLSWRDGSAERFIFDHLAGKMGGDRAALTASQLTKKIQGARYNSDAPAWERRVDRNIASQQAETLIQNYFSDPAEAEDFRQGIKRFTERDIAWENAGMPTAKSRHHLSHYGHRRGPDFYRQAWR